MKNNILTAIILKFTEFLKFKKQPLKNKASGATTSVFVSAVFLIAIAFLIYNTANAITVLTVDSSEQTQVVNPKTATVETFKMNRPEAGIYRNKKDLSGGILFSVFPVRGGNITSDYGVRYNPFDEFGFSEFHAGLDVAVPAGTPVVAAARGVVTFSGADGGYGNVVIIKHADSKVTTRYAHLLRYDVPVGAVVSTGQQIGLVGSTGRSTGPHLHFEVRIDDKTVDPMIAYPSR